MADSKENRRDGTSVKLFFAVLGAIVAYQLNGWMSGEPEWSTHRDEGGGFVVDVTGSVDQRVLRERLAFGEVEFQFLMFARGDVQYAVAYGDVPSAVTADSALKTAATALAEKVQGTVLSQRADTSASLAAQRVHVRAADESELQMLCLWREGRLYRLMAGGETDVEQNRADIERFFASFRPVALVGEQP